MRYPYLFCGNCHRRVPVPSFAMNVQGKVVLTCGCGSRVRFDGRGLEQPISASADDSAELPKAPVREKIYRDLHGPRQTTVADGRVRLAHPRLKKFSSVLGYDAVKKCHVQNKVKRLELTTPGGSWYEIEVARGKKVLLYKEQSVILYDGEVVHAKQLRVGDWLVGKKGNGTQIKSISRKVGRSTFYRFEIGGDHSYFLNGLLMHNASRYWVPAGTGNINSTSNWSATSGGASGASVPGTSDDATHDTLSGATGYTVTVNASFTPLSWTIGAPLTGVVTLAGSANLSSGGSVTFHSGMVNNWTGLLNFWGSGTAVLTTNGVTVKGKVLISNGPATLKLGDSLIVSVNGTDAMWRQTGSFDANGKDVTLTGAGSVGIQGSWTGSNAFYRLIRTGTAAKTDTLVIENSFECTKSGDGLTINSNSAINRVLVCSSVYGTARTYTGDISGSGVVDFQDIARAGGTLDISAVGSGTGDCGGNSGLTFTTSTTQTMTTGGSWSAATWTSRVPLAQDDVVLDGSSGNVNIDMPRLCRDINCTGYTNALNFITSPVEIYGGVVLSSGMAFQNTSGQVARLCGRGSHTMTCNTKSWPTDTTRFDARGGTYTWSDEFKAQLHVDHVSGTITAQGGANFRSFWSTGSATRAINMGSGTWTLFLVSVLEAWNVSSTGMTLNSDTSKILVNGSTTNIRTFAGGGLTYYNLEYTNATNAGQLSVTGSNSFNTFRHTGSNAQTVKFTAGTTTTIRANSTGVAGEVFLKGAASNLVTLGSLTAASHTISFTGTGSVFCPYLSISYSTVTQTTKAYAGTNSTDGGNNSNWIFTDVPVEGLPRSYMTMTAVHRAANW